MDGDASYLTVFPNHDIACGKLDNVDIGNVGIGISVIPNAIAIRIQGLRVIERKRVGFVQRSIVIVIGICVIADAVRIRIQHLKGV